MKKTYLNTLTPEEIVKRLKNGEFVKFDRYGRKELNFRMIDGVLIEDDGDEMQLGSSLLIEKDKNDYYFEEEEKFEIKETGVYKRRDGKKAFVYEVNEEADDNFVCYILENDGDCFSVTEQGRLNTYAEYPEDIVSKWED